MVHATFAEEQLHHFVLQGEVEEQPHFISFSMALGETLSGRAMATRILFAMSFAQPNKVGSTSGGSDFIVAYHIILCITARFTFSWNASSVGGNSFKGGALFLAFEVF